MRKHIRIRDILNDNVSHAHPACFDSYEQFHRWKEMLHISKESAFIGYCVDCTPEYKSKMMGENRCDHPETKFVKRTTARGGSEVIGASINSFFWHRDGADTGTADED